MQEWDNLDDAAEAKAREWLSIQMHNINVDSAIFLYDDLKTAHMHTAENDRKEEYKKVAKYLHVKYDGIDPATVNDALFAQYHKLFGEAKSQLERGGGFIDPIYDGGYTMPVKHRPPVFCHLEILTRSGRNVVIVTERKENPGMSVTNAIADLTYWITERFGLDPNETYYLEHYNKDSDNTGKHEETWARVVCRYDQDLFIVSPEWTHIPGDKMQGYRHKDIFAILDGISK